MSTPLWYSGSLSVNVSSSSGKNEFVNTGQLDVSTSSRHANYGLLPVGIAVFLVNVFLFPISRL